MCKYCELKSEGARNCERLFHKRGYLNNTFPSLERGFKKPSIYGYIGYRTNCSKKGEEVVIPKIIVSFEEGSLKDNYWKDYGWYVNINYCPMCGRKLV